MNARSLLVAACVLTAASGASAQYLPFRVADPISPDDAVNRRYFEANGGGASYANPLQMQNFRACAQAVRLNTGDCVVLGVGDSTMIGLNGAAVPQYPNLLANIATMLTVGGVNSQATGFMGGGPTTGTTGSRFDADPAFSKGGWSAGFAVTLGGYLLTTAALSTPFTYSPKNADSTAFVGDTADVYYVCSGSNGIFSITVNGGTAIMVNETTCTPTGTVKKITVSGTRGNMAVTLTYVSGGAVYVAGIIPRDSTKRAVIFVNAGWFGSTASLWTTSAGGFYDYIPTLQTLAPNLTLIQAGINDWGTQTPITSFTASVQTTISAAATSGDVMLLTSAPNPVNTSIQSLYASALSALSVSNKTALIQNWERWGGLVTPGGSRPASFMSDIIHPTPAGHGDLAVSPATLLLGLATGR